MYTLSNDQLEVAILDPIADQERFGPRYCTGGYIFQVADARHGPLLTGPTYPESFNWFDGQGIPDAFNLHPLHAPGTPSQQALIIGIGVCDLEQRSVLEYCRWEVAEAPQAITMRTAQAFGEFALELERSVSLAGRTVTSSTRLKNTGKWPISICWFPHPFFPQPESPELCRLSVPVQMPENDGYILAPNGFITRKASPGARGFYQALDHAAQSALVVLQRHPAVGLVGATCSYVPAFFPIWGNRNTFSWEPFYERTVAAAQETAWSIAYDF
jgi:hypothetical protein